MDATDLLNQALKRDHRAKKLFEAMPPSCQREYIRTIEEAKLSATKEHRLKAAVVHILASGKHKTTAGYSATPLVQKLGIGPGINIVIHAPEGYEQLLVLDTSIVLTKRLQPGADFVQSFYVSRRRLQNDFDALAKSLRKDGKLWISWPKGTSKIETDLNENTVREIGLAHGLVDVKVAAIDEDWSGLKFVYRVKDR